MGRYPLNRTAHGDTAAGQRSGGDQWTVDVPPAYQQLGRPVQRFRSGEFSQAQRLSGVGFHGRGKRSCLQASDFGKLGFVKLGYIRSPGLLFTSTIPQNVSKPQLESSSNIQNKGQALQSWSYKARFDLAPQRGWKTSGRSSSAWIGGIKSGFRRPKRAFIPRSRSSVRLV